MNFEPVREKIQAGIVERVLPSLAVAVAKDGEVVWEEAFGWADREARVPADPHTPYSLASISKPITATGLMLLVERGILSLDSPINDYLGDAKLTAHVGDADDATVRRVASHTSGLAGHCHCFYADESIVRPPMEETIRRFGHLVNPPGERYWYSNLGFGLLDHLISRLSGERYHDFMREAVFLPLGMSRSAIELNSDLKPFAAARYGLDGIRYPDYVFDHPGGSEVYCSVHDLIRFAMLHMKTLLPDQKRILSDESLAAMQAPTPLLEGTANYGIGWRTDDDWRGLRRVTHDGSMGGVSATLQFFPDEKVAVAVLCNTRTGFHQEIAEEILSLLFPVYAARLAEERTKRETEPKAEEKPFAPDADLLGEWAGSVRTYQGEIPFSLRVKESGDVHAKAGDFFVTLLNDARYDQGVLSGNCLGNLATEDVYRMPYFLALSLKRRGDSLCGATTAIDLSDGPDGGAPRRRMGNALSYWTDLKKSSG